MGMDTIDIEDLANDFGDDFVRHFTNLGLTALIGGTVAFASGGWLAWSVPLIREAIEKVVWAIGHTGGLILFMFNTKVFTTDQADDWTKEVAAVKSLPDDVSDDDWAEAERKRLHAFANLVNLKR